SHITPLHYFFFLLLLRPPRSTLFPYTTLFRSLNERIYLCLLNSSNKQLKPAKLLLYSRARVHKKPACWLNWQNSLPVFVRPLQRSEEHTSELQSRENLVCRLLLEKKKNKKRIE